MFFNLWVLHRPTSQSEHACSDRDCPASVVQKNMKFRLFLHSDVLSAALKKIMFTFCKTFVHWQLPLPSEKPISSTPSGTPVFRANRVAITTFHKQKGFSILSSEDVTEMTCNHFSSSCLWEVLGVISQPAQDTPRSESIFRPHGTPTNMGKTRSLISNNQRICLPRCSRRSRDVQRAVHQPAVGT